MAVFQNNLLAGAGAQSSDSTYKINQSIRFNPADNAYMQRTHGAGGDADKSTVSFWFKRSTFGVEVTMFGTGANVYNTFDIYFKTDNTMVIQNYAGSYQLRLITNQVFRDPAAWYHVVFVYDSANGNSTDRAKLYINGVRVTSFGTETYPSQNQDSILGTNVAIGFGRYISYGSSNTNQYFPGYLAEMNYVNGQALTPDSFGETNSSGIWVPKEYEGSYGTGGFFIDGRDASDLGDDESGNGNDMTTYGLATHDQMSDSPTTNWCVMNSLLNNGCTYTNGNLEVAPPNLQSTHRLVLPTMGILPSDTNKYYWEITYLASDNSSSVNMLGVAGLDRADNPANATLNGDGDGYGLGYSTFTSNIYAGGNWTNNGTPTWSGGFTAGAIYGVAYDGSTKRLYFYENNSALNSGNHFATYTGSAPLGPGASLYVSPSSSKLTFNMGANGFTYTPPTGYVAVNTTNLGS